MIDDTVAVQLENGLRTIESLFDVPKQPLPEVSPILTPGPTKFDPKTGKIYLGGDFESTKYRDYHRAFALGKALGSYTYTKLNPKIFERIYVESNEKYRESQKTKLNLEWETTKKEYYTIISIADTIVPCYAGLLYIERKLDRAKALQMGKDILQVAGMNALGESLSAFLSDKFDPDTLREQNTLDALGWFETERNLLPKLARITTRKEYEDLVRKNEVYSAMIRSGE